MKRSHPDSAQSAPKTSLELLKLVENPNFEELSRRYPEFHQAWKEVQEKQHSIKGKATFSSCITQKFTIALSRSLLHAYFELRLPHLPDHHLCPPIPNRFFFLHWIDSYLLRLQGFVSDSSYGLERAQRRTLCLDIGVGATCIYPLLAARALNYQVLGADIDGQALEIAQQNVNANNLSSRIRLSHVDLTHSQDSSLPPGGPLTRSLQAFGPSNERPDFCMTNPPFYDPDAMEQEAPRAGDGRERTNMTTSEGSYPGGEVEFVLDMICDSVRARSSSCRWCTTMLGKKSSLIHLEKLLKHVLGPAHVQSTEYGPGQYTRWFLAWTLERPLANHPAARVTHAKDSFQVAFPQSTNIPNPQTAVSAVADRIVKFCESNPGGWSLAAGIQQQSQYLHPQPRCIILIREQTPLPVNHYVDESEATSTMTLPPKVLEALQSTQSENSLLLPAEGHFAIYATVGLTTNGSAVQVSMECYRHSSRGGKAIDKIRNGMEGEVARTNRKWRRILQRQQQS